MAVQSLKTIHAKLVASAFELEKYTIYVFENLDADGEFKYITVTRLPNWEQPQLKVGDIGYLEYQEVRAGIDKWYNRDLGKFLDYGFSEIYFIKFVFENKSDNIIIDQN